MRRFIEILPPALLLVVHWVVATSFENLYGNRLEFEFGGMTILPLVLTVALVLLIAISVPALFLPTGLRSRYVALVFAVGCLGWFQSSFLPGDYGQLTGEAIDWSGYAIRRWFELLLWLGAMIAAIKFHRALRPNIRFIAPLLMILELVGIGGRQVLDPAQAPPPKTETAAASLSIYSRNQNVLHVLMDGFQTGVFLELVEEEGLQGQFDGFTVFRDNSAVAPYTAMSVPAIFSGEIYDGSETPAQYHHRALRQGGFQHDLKQAGFAVYLIPKIPMQGEGYTQYAETPHLYGFSREGRIQHQVAVLLDLNLFRSCPHLLRRVVFNDGNWLVRSQLGESTLGLNTQQRMFFADYIDQLQVTLEEPAYHFIHLMPPHGPFVTLEGGTDAGKVLPETRENYKTEARYILRLFLQLLDRLRELDLYDSCLIVLHADHGYGNLTLNPEHPRLLKIPRAPALLAIKRIKEHGSLKISDSPTSLADIPATVLGELGIDHKHPGQSVFDLAEGQSRPRLFNSYSLGAGNKGTIRRFLVDGSIYDPQAWQDLETRTVDQGLPSYQWGEIIEFGVGSDSDRFLGPAWSSGGAGGCRMNQSEYGSINLQAPPTEQKIRATLELRPRRRKGETRRLGFRLSCNGKSMGIKSFKEPRAERFEFTLPAGMASKGALDLKLDFLEFGPGTGSTKLAFCLISLQLEPVQGD